MFTEPQQGTYMKHIVTPLVLGPVIALIALSGHAQPVASVKKFDLKVQIVVETTPMVYSPLNVPAGTVVSASPPSIINCPMTLGVVQPTSGDCSEIGLPSTTNVKLLASANLPTAHFYQWKDMPGLSGTTVSSSCSSPMAPTITCTMAGPRAIQAVYKCNDQYSYNPKTQSCEGAGKNKYANDFAALKDQIAALDSKAQLTSVTTSGVAQGTTAHPNIDTPGIDEFIPPSDGWLKVDRPLQIGTAVIYKSKKGVVSIANGTTQIAWDDGSTSRIARTLEEVLRAK